MLRRAWFRLLSIAAIAATLASSSSAGTISLREPAQELPPIAFETRDGQIASLGMFKGKVTILHVWASWCGSCRAEFPSLLKLQRNLADRDVALVTVSVDRLGWAVIDRTLKELQAEALPVFLDRTREIPATLNTFGLPFSLIIGRDGREVARVFGAGEWDGPDIAALIEATLAR